MPDQIKKSWSAADEFGEDQITLYVFFLSYMSPLWNMMTRYVYFFLSYMSPLWDMMTRYEKQKLMHILFESAFLDLLLKKYPPMAALFLSWKGTLVSVLTFPLVSWRLTPRDLCKGKINDGNLNLKVWTPHTNSFQRRTLCRIQSQRCWYLSTNSLHNEIPRLIV